MKNSSVCTFELDLSGLYAQLTWLFLQNSIKSFLFLVIFSIYDIDKDGNISKSDLLKVNLC